MNMKTAAASLAVILAHSAGSAGCNGSRAGADGTAEVSRSVELPHAELVNAVGSSTPAAVDSHRGLVSKESSHELGANAGRDAGTHVSALPVRLWPYGPPACVQCQQLHCTDYFESDPFDSCTEARCREVVRCELDSDCFTHLNNIPQCYCGPNVDVATCQNQAFEPTGLCRDAIRRGLDATSNGDVLERFVSPKFPAGVAHQLATCIADHCAAPCIP